MWGTVLVIALVATADPVRLGMSVLLSSRPHPARSLLAFWLGGIATSIILAGGALFGLRDFTISVMHDLQHATASPAAGHVQVAMGLLALLVAALTVGFSPCQPARLSMPCAHSSHLQALLATVISRLSTRAQNAMHSRPVGTPFLLGVGMLVDLRFLAALTIIAASGANAGTQIGAAVAYTLIALAFVELPLASQLAAPERAGRIVSAAHDQMKRRRPQVFAVVIALLGIFLMGSGLGWA